MNVLHGEIGLSLEGGDMSLSRTMRTLGLWTLGPAWVLLGAERRLRAADLRPIATPQRRCHRGPDRQAAPSRDAALGKLCASNAAKARKACAQGIEAQAPSDFRLDPRPTTGIIQASHPSYRDSVVPFRGRLSVRFHAAPKYGLRVSYECGFMTSRTESTYVKARHAVSSAARRGYRRSTAKAARQASRADRVSGPAPPLVLEAAFGEPRLDRNPAARGPIQDKPETRGRVRTQSATDVALSSATLPGGRKSFDRLREPTRSARLRLSGGRDAFERC